MKVPEPYYKNIENIKAFLLGCDPTAFDKNGNRLEFEYVFDIKKDQRYFSGILKNLEWINLGLDDIYVQNLITSYQAKETSRNKAWDQIAKGYIQPRIDEFNLIDPDKTKPVLLTSQRLYKVLLKEELKLLKAKVIYINGLTPIKPEDNHLERPLIPLYRHFAYNLTHWPKYQNLLKSLFYNETLPST